MLDQKIGFFIEKAHLTINIYGKKAKVQVGDLVFFFGFAILLLSSQTPKDWQMNLGIAGILVMIFASWILDATIPRKLARNYKN